MVCCWHPWIVSTVDDTQMGEGNEAFCWKGYDTPAVQRCNKISQQAIDP